MHKIIPILLSCVQYGVEVNKTSTATIIPFIFVHENGSIIESINNDVTHFIHMMVVPKQEHFRFTGKEQIRNA